MADRDEDLFEGTSILESLAAVGKLDAFFEAVDSDDQERAAMLMKVAKVEPRAIAWVLRRMAEQE